MRERLNASQTAALKRAGEAFIEAASFQTHERDRNRKIKHGQAFVRNVLAELKALAEMDLELTWGIAEADEEGLAKLRDVDAHNAKMFASVKAHLDAVESTANQEAFERLLARHSPGSRELYKLHLIAAITRAREMVASISWICGSDEYRKMGFKPIPPPASPGTCRGPSVPLKDVF